MKRNGLIVLVIVLLLTALYFIELSKVNTNEVASMPTLDNLETDEISENWEPFYKVRAKIIDGQTARFSFPDEILEYEGKKIQLAGAIVFTGNGCEMINTDSTLVNYFFLLPSLGLAQACEIQPDIAMRWTIRVNLANPLPMSKTDMIDADVSVSGVFKIDTSKPYEAAFIIENALAELKTE